MEASIRWGSERHKKSDECNLILFISLPTLYKCASTLPLPKDYSTIGHQETRALGHKSLIRPLTKITKLICITTIEKLQH